MPLPTPETGRVIQFKYLWAHEHDAGDDEGAYPRPCIIVAVERAGRDTIVTVAPITHSPPRGKDVAIELPPRVKGHLGLDVNVPGRQRTE